MAKTYFEQVPLTLAEKAAAEEEKLKKPIRGGAGAKQLKKPAVAGGRKNGKGLEAA